MEVEKLAKNGEKGQNCYPLSPGWHRALEIFLASRYLGVPKLRPLIVTERRHISNLKDMHGRGHTGLLQGLNFALLSRIILLALTFTLVVVNQSKQPHKRRGVRKGLTQFD